MQTHHTQLNGSTAILFLDLNKLPYPTMGIAEMCHLPIKNIMDDGCKCFVWTTNGFLIKTIYINKAMGVRV